ncbi:MAG TPA: LuxR C-terminal-related transcriptional regulator [Chloroflexota bacterium]
MSATLWIVWIIIAIATLVGELLTLGLFFASLSVAALLTAGISLVAPLPVQVLAFCVTSLLMAIAVRPAALRFLPHGAAGQDTPVIGPVGERGLVVEPVTHLQGQIRIGNTEFWSARAPESAPALLPGREVEVLRMDGLTALVRPVEGPSSPGEVSAIVPGDSAVVPFGLSPREVDVLRLIAMGLSNAEIAERLFLSPRTVHHHVSHILNKMNASSRLDAVRLGVESHLIQLGSQSHSAASDEDSHSS